MRFRFLLHDSRLAPSLSQLSLIETKSKNLIAILLTAAYSQATHYLQHNILIVSGVASKENDICDRTLGYLY